MLHALVLLAQAGGEVAKKEGEGAPIWSTLPMLLAIGALFYFLIVLPGRREKQQRQALINALKKNDKVVTIGGVIGVVQNIKEGGEEVVIRSDETRLVVQRSSIARIITEAAKDSNAQQPSKG